MDQYFLMLQKVLQYMISTQKAPRQTSIEKNLGHVFRICNL